MPTGRNCCYFHAERKGDVEQPCQWLYPVAVSIWHNTDGRVGLTLDHSALVQGHSHVEPASGHGQRCSCGWRNLGILCVGREKTLLQVAPLPPAVVDGLLDAVRTADRGIAARLEKGQDAADLLLVRERLTSMLGTEVAPGLDKDLLPTLEAVQLRPLQEDRTTVVWSI